MKILDLFSGIGGISLGLERAGMQTVAFCEIEPFQRAVLRKHWPEVPVYEDIRTVSADVLRRFGIDAVDIVAGGFPCQDVSVAGKGLGVERGKRSGLWREMFRIIRELMPRWVLAENVPALRTRGADLVIADLEAAGYAVWPLVVGAWSVGAPHKRDRVWIVAYRNGDGSQGQRRQECRDDGQDSRRDIADGRGQKLVYAESIGRQGQGNQLGFPAGPGQEQRPWESPRLEWPVGAATDGLSEQLVRFANKHTLRSAGNSVVPQVVEVIGRAIMAAERANP